MVLNRHEQTIVDEFQQSLTELVESYSGGQSTLACQETGEARGEITSVVGLCDSRLSASICVTTSTGSARKLAGLAHVNTTDWIGEISNQLAGRLKNKLTTYGLNLQLSTPTTIRGGQLRIPPSGAQSVLLTIRFDNQEVSAQLNLELSERFQMVRCTESLSAPEGTVHLF